MLKKVLLFVYNIKACRLVLLWLHPSRIATVDLSFQQPFCLEYIYIYIYQGTQHAFLRPLTCFFLFLIIWRPSMLPTHWPQCLQHVLKKEKC